MRRPALVEAAAMPQGLPSGRWQQTPAVEARLLTLGDSTGCPTSRGRNTWREGMKRICNRCNSERGPRVTACPKCGSPEFRIKEARK